jgi:NAD-dependent DNA ligase
MTNLTAADHTYYSCQEPLMTDAEYDAAVRATGHVAVIPAGFSTLENAISEAEFLTWIEAIPADTRFLVQYKLDGVSAIVTFSDGIATSVRTRKLDVTTKVFVPNRGDFTGEVRGEIWSACGRDFVSGHLRRKVATTNPAIHFTDFNSPTLNLQRNADARTCLSLWADWKAGKLAFSAPTDGLVVKVEDPALRAELGETTRAPRWALALK